MTKLLSTRKRLWMPSTFRNGRITPQCAPLWTPPRAMFVFPSSHFGAVAAVGPALVAGQNIDASALNSATVAATWPATTTAGNLLIAVVGNMHGSAIPAITTLADWTLAISTTCDPGAGLRQRVGIYYIANSAARSGAETWTGGQFMSTSTKGVVLLEYSGCATVSPLDVTAATSDTSGAATSCSSGTTAEIAQAVELIISACTGGSALSTASSGWTIQDQTSGVALILGASHRITSAIATQTMACTYVTPLQNCGAIATFKGA